MNCDYSELEPKNVPETTTEYDCTFDEDPTTFNKDLPDDPEIPLCETAQVV